MRKHDRKELGRYVRYVADEMGLRDWHLELLAEPPDGQAIGDDHITLADVSPSPGRRHATIRFCADFRELNPETQRMAVVHELVHLHLAPLQHQCENDLSAEMLGGPASHVFFCGFRRNLEYAVDAMTCALAPHLPLIDWPD